MKLIFFGTSDFALVSLKKIMGSGHELLAVVTQPDRKKGRRLAITAPPVKSALKGSSIPILQPQDASGLDMVKVLKNYNADLFIVVEFGQILKSPLLDLPKISCINLHSSLLPKYRGAAPVNWAIINGDSQTGVTTMRMDEGMDTGDIILMKEVNIEDSDTSQTLSANLAKVGADLLIETIDLIEAGKAQFIKQAKDNISYAHKLKKTDGLIDWSATAHDINNKVRGLIPWPCAYTHWKKKLLKIYKSRFNSNPVKKEDAGRVVRIDNGIVVGTGRGELIIGELQLESGKRLKADEFLRGHSIKPGEILK